MKKLFLSLAMLFALGTTMDAQSTMTDQQLVTFLLQEKEKGSSQSEIITKLMQRGVDIQQIQRVKRKYERQIQQAGMGAVADQAMSSAENRMRTNNGQTRKPVDASAATQRVGSITTGKTYTPDDPEFMQMQAELGGLLPVDSIAMLNEILEQQRNNQNRIFGHDLFSNEALSFEPNMNIATPRDYVLGPGDQVLIDIYGASQESFSATVSPDGYITIEGFGPVQVSGLTVSQANARVRSQVGARYSSSQIRLSVGQTRTITVNIAGEVRTPGTYTLSAFATVFNALYMAGGINDLGTLRNIKVYRNNRLISTVDVYDYILNGQATGNVRLTDNDMIIVEAYDCLVSISGRVKRPMYYEMKQNESLKSLIKYAGGFTGNAYRGAVRVMRKSGALHSVHTVNEFDMGTFHMADGDSVNVDSILSRYSNMAEIKGAVFRPGLYEIGNGATSVRSLIERGGLTEDAFTTHAVMHRMKADRTLEVLAVDVAGIMEGRVADVPLQNEDVLYIPSRKERLESQTLTIHGEVQYPGIYKYAENETIEDFILQAGGLTDAGSMAKVDVARRIIDPNATTSQETIAQTYSFAVKDGFVIDGEQAFTLQPYDEVYVRKSPGYSEQQNVKVEGEVLFEGTYTLSKKSERLSEIITKAGGLTKTAFAKGARLVRQRTPEELARQTALMEAAKRSSGKDSIDVTKIDMGAVYPVGIDLEEAMRHPGGDADVVLREGDRIIIPEYSGTVKINGEVMYPNTVGFLAGKDYKYYINQAGGFGDNAKKRQTYIIYMNGTVAKADRKHKPAPGCEIVVPTKQARNKLSTAELLAIGTSTASIATMIATIVNVLK
ncbi:MAG: SLBB domain-containing protein [Prevotella sp.]|nr:SLBB domain-containing protein [Prevotella sp.]